MQLFIQTPGTYVHIKDQLFEIRIRKEGKVEKHAFAAQKVSSILMHTGVALSTDAIALALRHNIDLVFLEHSGQPFGRVWHTKLGSTTRIRKRQLEASLGAEGLVWVKSWIVQKLQGQLDFLKDLKKHRKAMGEYLDDAVERISALQARIDAVEAQQTDAVADSLRGWEGTAGRLYFQALSTCIPPAWKFAGRSSRPAQDPFNAFLNYAYGILYAQTEKALMIAGIDPYVGFLHRDDYNQKSLVFDFIEPYRNWADRVVFRLFSGKKVSQNDVDVIPKGFRLNATGKPLLVEAYNQFTLEQKIRYRGRNLSRMHAMQLDAHRFANSLIERDPADRLPEMVTL